MKISIIVPMYNVENYIEECIDSLLNQSIDKALYEIIVINDGSTDKSLEIIENRYLNKVSNIRVITKVNGGLSSARNVGIEVATGEYIMFIDSDDVLEADFLKILYDEIEKNNYDVVFSTYYWYFEKENSKKLSLGMGEDNTIYTDSELCEYLYKNKNFKSEVCDDIYKLKFLKENNISFEENIIYEDEMFTAKVICNLRKAKTLQYAGYLYRQRENSITKTKNYELTMRSLQKIINEFMIMYDVVEDTYRKKFIYWRSLAILEAMVVCAEENNRKLDLNNEIKMYFLKNSTNLKEWLKVRVMLRCGIYYNKIIQKVRKIRGE